MIGKIISDIFLSGLNAILGTIGKTVTNIHTSNTARQQSENQSGVQAHGQYVEGHTAAGAQRADYAKSGKWGPFGLAAFIISLLLAYHTGMVVLDSTSWHVGLTTKYYIVPWLEWRPHIVGSWGISALPGMFEQTEHEILRALFWVGPPSAALALLAKAFRR